jgi:antitoxin component of MazEF toxin-antitoxin module
LKTTGKLTRNGNCQALIIPRPQMATLGWQPDEPVVYSVVRGMLVITSVRAEIERLERQSAEVAEAMHQGARP